ncbi:hypothetical protein D3C81_2125310 [compost metagenome]
MYNQIRVQTPEHLKALVRVRNIKLALAHALHLVSFSKKNMLKLTPHLALCTSD